ncbi:MAG: Gldg family protein [Planctomycetota bacterium]|nr:Gldg family protein [Planctomycetota bacterium]
MALARRSADYDWRSRLSIGARVVVAVVLALFATLLVTWIAERSELRWRHDLTAAQENTLNPATVRVLREMPRDIAVDVFFSAPEPPFHIVGREVQDRMRRLLRLAADQSGGRVAVEDHDLSDRTRLSPRTQARRQELGLAVIEPGGLVAVSSEGRRHVLRLRGDLADLDPGNADSRQGPVVPPRVAGFRGEEALLGAILKVSEGRTPIVVFTAGHGELDLDGPGERGAVLLARELKAQGFQVQSWNGARGTAFPAADIAVVLGADQRFTDAEFAELATFVDRGGRALVALGPRVVGGESSPEALLARFGAKSRDSGIVCMPMPSVSGGLQTGIPQCAYAVVGFEGMPAQNPITDPLRTADQRVMLFASRAFDRVAAPRGARVLDLLRSAPESWLEAPIDGTDRYDYAPENDTERTRYSLAMQVAFPPVRNPDATLPSSDPARAESRILAIGSADALANHLLVTNRDFVVNAFDWLASREYRVRVESTNRESRKLDLSDPVPVSRVHTVTVILLPGLCLCLGLLTLWLRRRST